MKYIIKFKGGKSREYGEGKLWLSYYEAGGIIPILGEYELNRIKRGGSLGVDGKKIGGGISLDGSDHIQMMSSLILRMSGEGDLRQEVLLRGKLKGRQMGNWEHVSYSDGRGRLVMCYPFLKPVGARQWGKVIEEISLDLDRIAEIEKSWKSGSIRVGRKSEDLMVVRGERLRIDIS